MKQYIDKDTIIAEIERLIAELVEEGEDTMFEQGRISAFEDVKVFINHTLEVKEVDLEAEFDNYTKDILACDIQFEPFTHLHNCAKYFFELGLKAKGE